MPFDRNLPRSFSAISIRTHAPAASGVYGLTNSRAWLFIGETDNIQESLLSHLRDGGEQATGFVFEICPPASRDQRQSRLVQEYIPTGNRR